MRYRAEKVFSPRFYLNNFGGYKMCEYEIESASIETPAQTLEAIILLGSIVVDGKKESYDKKVMVEFIDKLMSLTPIRLEYCSKIAIVYYSASMWTNDQARAYIEGAGTIILAHVFLSLTEEERIEASKFEAKDIILTCAEQMRLNNFVLFYNAYANNSMN